MRASAAVEKAGVPTASLVCDGFVGQAAAITPGLGVETIPIARIVGHVDGQSVEELQRNIDEVTAPEVIRCLLEPAVTDGAAECCTNGMVVGCGDFDSINRLFLDRQWSDGLPIVPPTRSRVAAFLAETRDDPDRLIGVLQPSGSAATVTNVAINGVMANCRPEYMPVLIAIAEVLCDPGYGVEHSGDTTGGDPLIILNGPVIEKLGFNCADAALRDGYQANTSVGRFIRLYQRNVAGFLPEGADKGTFGHTWRVVLAEHEAEAKSIGWPSLGEDRGFGPEENLVTIGRFTSGGGIGSIYGNDPQEIARYLADGLVRHTSWELIFTVGFARGTYRPLLVISPLVAKTLQRAGMSKENLRSALFDYARLPAEKLERYIGQWTNLVPGKPTLDQLVAGGTAAAHFASEDDPQRLVPIVEKPEDILIIVSGDPLRSNAYAFASNGMHGFPTSKRIRIPG
ncbi:MAG: hypothetical protein OXT01_00155 [Rhodospirillaceae bacterium]|nr:hypothetical protein [Rhodospirillaceae bacterium]